jgi:hypothetical protein
MTPLTSTTSIRLITYNCVQIWIYGNAIYIYDITNDMHILVIRNITI